MQAPLRLAVDVGLRPVYSTPSIRWGAWQLCTGEKTNVLVNPLVDEGYPSIGCAPCTVKPAGGADPRSGRWQGRTKTECGLHVS